MKTFTAILSFLCSFTFNTASSQQFWNTVNNYNESSSITATASSGDSLIIVAETSYSCVCRTSLKAYNRFGDTLWTKNWFSTIEKIILRNDTIYTSGTENCSDTPKFDARFAACTLKGEIIYEKSYPDPYLGTTSNTPNLLSINKKGDLIATSSNHKSYNDLECFLINDTGKIVKKGVFNLDDKLIDISYTSDTTSILTTVKGCYSLNSDLQIVDSLILNDKIISAINLSPFVYLFTPSKIVKVNYHLSAVDSMNIKKFGEKTSLKSFNDTIFIQRIFGGEVKINTLFNMNWTDSMVFDSVLTETLFEPIGNNIVFAGTTSYRQAAVYEVSRNQKNIDSLLPNSEIKQVKINNVTEQYQNQGGPIVYIGYCLRYDVLVKNNGNDTIKNIGLVTNTSAIGVVCYYNYYNRVSTEIAPGEEKWITNLLTCQSYTRNISFCVDAIAPNGQLETEISTNKYCNDYGTVSTRIVSKNVQTVIHPNPVQSTLYFGETAIQYEIIDAFGKTIAEGYGASIDCCSYSPGNYFIKLQGLNNVQIRKFVKL